ncbi:MAG: MBL fold metallo-hydrolase [Methanolinea sp.]|nr:MBL fold metallo-hydrolase [Methanolinea sp.]
MKVTFLGTNGWFDSLTGNTCSVLVQTDEYDIIFDAGNGIAKLDRYISQDRPVFLFISHYHIDHIAGLHTLVKYRFSHPLQICGQIGISSTLRSFVREPFTVPIEHLPFPVSFVELHEGTHDIGFPVECRMLVHPVPCFGYALTIDHKKIAYCIDTGFCENAVLLAGGADLLICECGLKPGEESPEWPHLNPEHAIRIAKEAHAKRLALTHFAAHIYTNLEERYEIQRIYEKDCPGLLTATDDLTVEL